MGERRGTKGLELWCKKMTEGYSGVKIENMTTSWRDGLAFCAMIHHFRPDLIEFSKLNKDDIYVNNELAFRIAEDHLGIPALLEPEDMVECSVPDRLSILTYLSQFYQAFAVNQSNSPVKTPPKRQAELQMHMVSAASSSPPKKAATSTRLSSAFREPCAKCALPVFIAERITVGKALYHRSCFRCARCHSQLTLENYYETENDQYCCETCPDEEKPPSADAVSNLLRKSLSDEEKSASIKHESDLYSSNFENLLEHVKDDSLKRSFTFDRLGAKARSEFMTAQLRKSSSSDSDTDDSGNENKPPDLTTDVAERRNENTTRDVADLQSDQQRLPIISSFSSDSGFKNTKDNIESRLDDEDAVVTKDVSFDPASLSIRSRIRLFEGASKFDTPRQIGVTYAKDSVDNLGNSLLSNSKDDLIMHSEKAKELADSSVTKSSVSEKEADDESSASFNNSDNYSVSKQEGSSERVEESIVVISSDNSSFINDSPAAKEDTSVITISDESAITSDRSKKEEATSRSKECFSDVMITITDTSEDQEESSVISSEASTEPPRPSRRTGRGALKSPTKLEVIGGEPSQSATPDGVVDVISSSGDHKKVEYPNDLNPFDDVEEDEEEVVVDTSKVSLNPFGDSEDEEEEVQKETRKPEAAPRRLISAKSFNPFGSEDEGDDVDDVEEEQKMVSLPPQPAVRKLIKAPKISLPAYWNDDVSPVAMSRSPRTSSDSSSLSGSGRKKKPAPRPPLPFQDNTESPASSICSSPSHSVCHSPKSTPKGRKMKRAPLPPRHSTPIKPGEKEDDRGVAAALSPNMSDEIGTRVLQFRTGSEENLKSVKNESNRNKQNASAMVQNEGPSSLPNKSTYGKWKRRKAQAPPRPIPQRRPIQGIPVEKIKQELEMIEVQMLGLEKHGVKLEQLIREKSEGPDANEDEALPPEVEDMIIQLFELVNEKNELSRKQAELMYLRRQHRLEEEHADIEYQIRCLMLQPEANKTDCDKAREEELINRLLEIVERRNQIVDCLEMDRKRAADEDTSISSQMNLYAMKRDEELSLAQKKSAKKEKHKHKKEKEKKSKSKSKFDADKDVDESEVPSTVKEKKKKKKFNLF